MNFNSGLLQRRQQELHEQGVRITFSGRRDWRVPKKVLTNMKNAFGVDREEQGADAQHRLQLRRRRRDRGRRRPTRRRQGPATRSTKRRCALVCITRNCPTGLVISHFGGVPDLDISCLGDGRTRLVFTGRAVAGLSPRELFEPWRSTRQRERRFGSRQMIMTKTMVRRRRPHLRFLWALYAAVTPVAARAAPHPAVLAVMVALVLACQRFMGIEPRQTATSDDGSDETEQ